MYTYFPVYILVLYYHAESHFTFALDLFLLLSCWGWKRLMHERRFECLLLCTYALGAGLLVILNETLSVRVHFDISFLFCLV